MEKKKSIKFEEAIKRLEEIIDELESGDFDLDKAVEIFEEGVKLSKFCKTKLDEAEQKIEIIKKQDVSDIVQDSEKDISEEKKEDYKNEKADIGLLLNTEDKK